MQPGSCHVWAKPLHCIVELNGHIAKRQGIDGLGASNT